MTTIPSTRLFSEDLHASELVPYTFEPLDWNDYVYPNPSDKDAYNVFWFHCSVGGKTEDPERIKGTGVQTILDLNEKFNK